MTPYSSDAPFERRDFGHNGTPHGIWTRIAEEAMGAGAMIGVAFAIDALERPWRALRKPGEKSHDRGRAAARAHDPYFGSPRFLWASIGALALLSRAKRDPVGLRTAARLALAVAAAQGVARATRSWVGRASAPSGPRLFSERSAAAWAAAGVLERAQGKGPGLTAYSAAALAGYPREGRTVADAVAGAVIGRLIGRLVGQIRLA